jgi:asparagine synthase (glutamine-hydrolysing)
MLGHRRLSIIDLSQAGCQPMHDSSGRFVIVYNGEVYNYIELRDQLRDRGHAFNTQTDTEVVLAAYREWGAECLRRFNGMWAMAIWDRQRRELFLARDRAGKKPLYYAFDAEGTLYFSSEVKALGAAGLRFTANAQALADFITQGTYGHLGERGFFHELRQVPAAHWLTFGAHGVPRTQRYWDLPTVGEGDRRPYDASVISEFRELLVDAVRLRLRSDVPVGATLSGGLDSSTIALVADRLTGGRPLHIFTSLYPGTSHDETPFFRAVVERLADPIVHHVTPEREPWPAALDNVLLHQEEPFGDTSILAHFHLMRQARQSSIPVVLSGQGGDELLLGYHSMVNAYFGHLLARARVGRWIREAREWAVGIDQPLTAVVRSSLAHALPLALRDRARAAVLGRRARLLTDEVRRATSLKRFESRAGRHAFDSYIAQVFSRFAIPHLVHYDDRNAMAWSIEGRMPFLDYRLLEFVGTVAYDALFARGRTKRILRDAFADVLPRQVAERRDKIGFFTPMAAWLADNRVWLQSFMSEDRLESVGLLRAAPYRATIDRALNGESASALDAWRGLIVHLWMDRFQIGGISASADGDTTTVPRWHNAA